MMVSPIDLAFSMLKASPYEQAYIEQLDHEWPRGFGQGPAVHQQPMGKIHDAILGLMRRNMRMVDMDNRIRVPGERPKGVIEDIPSRHLLAEPIYDYQDYKQSYKGGLGDDYTIYPEDLSEGTLFDEERFDYRMGLEDEGLQPHPVPRAIRITPRRDQGFGYLDDSMRHDFEPAGIDEEGNFYMNEPPAITSIYPREI